MKFITLPKKSITLACSVGMLSTLYSSVGGAHGLVESPPSRQQFCGVLTKPHETANANALYPECAEAFEGFVSGGYSYMSVLTHARGRLRPLPELEPGETAPDNEAGGTTPALASNVCGYDAETFDNGATPWDTPMDWPTTAINSGRNLFLWNISWGPHFDDTQEFHYWITKEEFQFEVGKALSWDDFEEQPFCKLDFNRDDFNANPDIVADTDNAKFYTYCDVPERSGQHVIYAEWGRNYFTWERFHGCIDVTFGETTEPSVTAQIDVTPIGDLSGSGSVQLSASESSGEELTYLWSVSSSTTDATYTLSSQSSELTTLNFTDPSDSGQVTVLLTVSSGSEQASQSVTLNHQSESVVSQWNYIQPLSAQSTQLASGDTVQLRVVLANGEDIYLPETPLTLTSENAAPEKWPLAVANAVNDLDGVLTIGVLNSLSDTVEPVESATANNIYANISDNIASVFVNIDSDSGETEPTEPVSDVQCYYEVSSQWSGGFSAKVIIENNSTEDITGWQVNWSYSDGSYISSSWNANLQDSYTASNLTWNALIPAGDSVEFGFNGVSTQSTAEVPEVTGDICNSSSTPVDVVDPDPVVPELPVDTDPVEPDPVEPTEPNDSEPVEGTVLISEGFEDNNTGDVPAGWGTNVNYNQSVADSSEALQHSEIFTVVDDVANSGEKSVLVSGIDQSKRYLFKDISGLSEERLYVRLYIRSSEYIGNRADESMNHNHFLALSDADQYNEQEVRIGEMKGAIGVNESVSDDLYPKYEFWWGKTETTRLQADTWYCVEASFDNTGDSSSQKIWIDEKLVADITSADDFNNGSIASKWLTDRFARINIGWASWNTYANNLYFDDIVVATERVGCL